MNWNFFFFFFYKKQQIVFEKYFKKKKTGAFKGVKVDGLGPVESHMKWRQGRGNPNRPFPNQAHGLGPPYFKIIVYF